jgi:hypothetical protein
MCMYVFVCMYSSSAYVYTSVCMFILVRTDTHTLTQSHRHVHACTLTCMHAHTRMHTCGLRSMFSFIRFYVCVCMSSSVCIAAALTCIMDADVEWYCFPFPSLCACMCVFICMYRTSAAADVYHGRRCGMILFCPGLWKAGTRHLPEAWSRLTSS